MVSGRTGPLFLVIGCYVCETNESDDGKTLCVLDEHTESDRPPPDNTFVSPLFPEQTFKKISSIREGWFVPPHNASPMKFSRLFNLPRTG